MPRNPQKGGSVRLSEETIEKLRKMAKHSPQDQKEIVATLVDMNEIHDLLRPDWKKRLDASLRRGMWQLELEKHQASQERCDSLRGADEKWKCIVGRKKKTPMIRILAENRSDALNLCEGCEITKARNAELEEYARQIKTLQQEIQTKNDVTFKVPICHKGATLNEDATEFRGCPKSSAKEPVPIATYCKVLSGGLPCMLYAERVIGVGEKVKSD